MMKLKNDTDSRYIAEQIFLSGVNSVLPDKLIADAVFVDENMLRIANREFSQIANIWVIGAGKAGAIMALEVEKILGDRIAGGHIITKYGHSVKLKKIAVTEAGHPVPDQNSFTASKSVLDIAQKAEANDLVICLLSGGGSALLCDAPDGLLPDDIIKINDLLVKSGATINEINAVRKHLSDIKGGKLASAIYPAHSVSLILSDVIGDKLDVIASGPTAPDPTTYADAIDVVEKYEIGKLIPQRVIDFLNDGALGKKPETPKSGDIVFSKTANIVIGNNRIALENAKLKALEFNLNPVIIDDKLQGDVVSVAEYLVETALKYKADVLAPKPACLLFGGETTTKPTGNGLGGRNQHLALLCAKALSGKQGITILCAGTDGTDGPTDAAGAVVDTDTTQSALSQGVDPEIYLADFNSYNFFKHTSGHIITGPTLTNVMDIAVIIVE
jgi:glycerate-2-kinase